MTKDVHTVRSAAIALHEDQAGEFSDWYRQFNENVYSTAFGYGRKKLEELLYGKIQNLPAGAHVLDIGCGTGEQIRRISTFGLNVTGMEPAPNMRAHARRMNPKVSIIDGTADDIPFPDKYFDFVLAIEVYRYLSPQDVVNSLKEAHRVLRPGGTLFFTMVNPAALDGFFIYQKIREHMPVRWSRRPVAYCHFANRRKIKSYADQAGFESIDFFGRMFAPLRAIYKINDRVGAWSARHLERLDDYIGKNKSLAPFMGHYIAIATRD